MKYQVGQRVRALREDRRWSQEQLAAKLEISQSRLSQIELGRASLTAEQFLDVLQLFNVPTSVFVEQPAPVERLLQNTLAHLGAHHLRVEPGVLPDERLEVHEAFTRVLNTGEARLLAALAPVIVEHAREINFAKLAADADRSGRRARLYWLIENTLEATRLALQTARLSRAPSYRAAIRELERVLAFSDGYVPETVDVLEPGLRTRQAVERAEAEATPISRKWRVVSPLTPATFLAAIREADADR